MNVFGDQNLKELLEKEDNSPSIDHAILREDEEAVYVRFRNHNYYPYEDGTTLDHSFGVFESLFRPKGLMDRFFEDIEPEFRLHLFYDEAGMFSVGRVHAATPIKFEDIENIREEINESYDRRKFKLAYKELFSYVDDPDGTCYDPKTGESNYRGEIG